VYFAPILDKTAVMTTNFFATIEADIYWKTTNIIWSKASTKGGNWIVLFIDNMDDLHCFREKPEVGGKFVVVSWVDTTIEETDHYKEVIRPLTPLIITPLFSDHNPKQATVLIASRENNPMWGPISNTKKLTLAKAFQDRVWVAPKRNQILRNAFLTKPTACITPVVPVNKVDQTTLILYYKGPGMADTATITELIQEHIGHTVPHLAMVAQFYDHASEEELPKWLLGFNLILEVEKFAADKDWPKLVLQYRGISLVIGKCGEIKAPPKPNKTQSTKKCGGGALRGRGKKSTTSTLAFLAWERASGPPVSKVDRVKSG
jgi:hypothetical protein